MLHESSECTRDDQPCEFAPTSPDKKLSTLTVDHLRRLSFSPATFDAMMDVNSYSIIHKENKGKRERKGHNEGLQNK